jgi:DNA-binding NtrC family response regulator
LGGSIAPCGTAAAILPLIDPSGEVRPLDELETEVIRFAVNHYRGRMSEVARRLRIGRSTLYRKLDLLELDTDDPATDNQSAVKAL